MRKAEQEVKSSVQGGAQPRRVKRVSTRTRQPIGVGLELPPRLITQFGAQVRVSLVTPLAQLCYSIIDIRYDARYCMIGDSNVKQVARVAGATLAETNK